MLLGRQSRVHIVQEVEEIKSETLEMTFFSHYKAQLNT